MRSRRLLIAAAATLSLVLPALPAYASGPGGWVDVDEDGSEIGLGAADGRSAEGARGGQSGECTWTHVPDGEVQAVWWEAGSEIGLDEDGEITDASEYAWYWMSCPAGDGGHTLDLIPVRRDEGPVDPALLREEAIDRLRLPIPTVAMNPTGEQVVHVETWLWIDDAIWRTHSRSVSAGGITTTVTAAPRRVLWDLGNGDTTVCDGPGAAYDPSRPAEGQTTDCSYTYAHTSAGQPDDAYQVSATVEWEVSWSVTGASGGGPLPALFTSTPVSVRVAEMQALNQ